VTVNHGFRALAEAQRSLPTPGVAHVADGPVQYLTAGDGRPAIVLLNGLGMPYQAWALIFGELASVSTVFAHNRLGVGTSAAPRRPQTGTAIVETLRAALAAARVPPPYVLVGHALGGLYANLYARLFPHELAGLVLLEATHPDDDVLERQFRFLPRVFTRTVMATAITQARRNAEQRFTAHTALEIAQAGPCPNLPLAVVTGARTPSRLAMSPARVQSHASGQQQLVALSAIGKQIVAPNSGHFPAVTEIPTFWYPLYVAP
jgi:pimeloyl-ACP methyl ester carboxylesterase